MNAEELELCRNLKAAAAKAMKSKRTLRILSRLEDRGIVNYDPFGETVTLTEAGAAALSSAEANSAAS